MYNIVTCVVLSTRRFNMQEYYSSVSPKGQITIPAEVRRLLNVKPRDRVAIVVEGKVVKLAPARSRLDASFQAVPAISPARTLEEMAEIAADEHAQHVAREGL
jgi:AbrB family looped-hinge helix DNA binding protein